MATPAHKNNTTKFPDLTFAEQAKSITASINNLQNAISHHAKHRQATPDTRKKCLRQIDRLLGRMIERLLIIAVVLAVSGCGGFTPEGSARKELTSLLDRWVSGQPHKPLERPVGELSAVLLDYDIKTFNRMTDGAEVLLFPNGDWYSSTVNLTFESEDGSEIKRQHRWTIYRETKDGAWKARCEL